MGFTQPIHFNSWPALYRLAAAEGGFQPYSAMHAAVVVVFVLTTACFVWLRRRWSESPRAGKLDRALGISALIIWLAYKLYVWLPGVRAMEYSLPLQMCDVTGLIAPLALLSGRRSLRAILYFWGIGLSALAFITPDLHEGMTTGRFWLFWLSHAAIVGSALYELAGRRFRPDWRDWRTPVVAATVYLALVLPFDVLTGFDYGYVGRPAPGQPAILDALGRWPGRVAVQAVLVAAELALLLLPWELFRRLSRRETDSLSSGNIIPPVNYHDHSTG